MDTLIGCDLVSKSPSEKQTWGRRLSHSIGFKMITNRGIGEWTSEIKQYLSWRNVLGSKLWGSQFGRSASIAGDRHISSQNLMNTSLKHDVAANYDLGISCFLVNACPRFIISSRFRLA